MSAQEITPTGSRSRVYLDTTPLASTAPIEFVDTEAFRAEAVQKLIDDFGFTEAMARAVVGT